MLGRLRELGYPKLRTELRFADGFERLAPLAAELVRAKVDVVAVSGLQPALAMLNANPAVPVVMALLADPNDIRVVANLAGQGANLTGAMVPLAELNQRRLELLREALPQAKRIGVLVNPENPSAAPLIREVEPAGAKLGLELHGLGARRPEQLPSAFEVSATRGIGALLVLEDPLFAAHAATIGEHSAASRIPVLGFDARLAQAGALLGFGVDRRAMYRSLADYVAYILGGKRATELSLQRAVKLELVLNRKAAAALGVSIAPGISGRADRVID